MKRNVLSSPRLLELKKQKRRIILNKFLFSLLGLLIIFGFLAYCSRFSNLNISEIQINGNKTIDTEIIRTTVAEKIAGKYLWLFPKTNILYYPENAIKNMLQSKFKRIEKIDLSVKNNKILEISLTERKAAYTWCGSVLPENTTGTQINNSIQKCYFLDESGFLFDEAPYFSGEVYFKFYGLTSGTENSIGSYFFKDNFKQLISFKNILVNNISLKPVALYITPDNDVEIFLSRGTSTTSTNGPKIIFKMNSDIENIAENLEAALSTEPLKTKFKEKYSTLQYIDLRFGNKVYDKFQ